MEPDHHFPNSRSSDNLFNHTTGTVVLLLEQTVYVCKTSCITSKRQVDFKSNLLSKHETLGVFTDTTPYKITENLEWSICEVQW